jgi:hypothetical protein
MRSSPPRAAALIRQGWISLALWITFGILLEGFIGFRIPALLDDSVRRELFRLAHAHGTLLSLVLLTAAICARLELIRLERMSSLGLRAAALLLPFGFLLGGLWHFKDDPGPGIVLVPVGALLLLAAALHLAWSAPVGKIRNSNIEIRNKFE